MTIRTWRLNVATAASATAMAAVGGSSALAQAATAAKIDAGDTAWIIVATALVLMMTLPGLALFYAGMVRKKNILATLAQSLAAVFAVSLLWAIVGYSLAFSGDGPVLGTLGRIFLSGMTMNGTHTLAPTIPESLFMIYQMTFAVITVALISGAVAERMRFSAFLLFACAWLIFVYAPIAHWVWGGGFLGAAGVMDFAGGTVVHLNCGVAALVAAYVLGARRGYGTENMAPYNLTLAVIGTGMLWVGWFGFNGGSALGAGGRATMAIVVTHLAACAGVLAWMACEWLTRSKPSVLGMISGAIAGLGTITPASGFVTPMPAILIGLIAGCVCFWGSTKLKQRLGYDDTLDVFGIHGIGGALGTLLTGVFAVGALSATADSPAGMQGLFEGNAPQLLIQLYGIVVTLIWSGVVTWILLKVIDLMLPLRVSQQQEVEGLDITQHGESLQ
jgi:Amt family ammonium transporter